MIIFKILSIRNAARTARDAANDPVRFGVDELLSPVKAFVIQTMTGIVVLLAIFGVFGFTSWITEPVGFMRVLFWVVLVVGISFGIGFVFLFRWIRRVTESTFKTRKKPHVDYEINK